MDIIQFFSAGGTSVGALFNVSVLPDWKRGDKSLLKGHYPKLFEVTVSI